MASKKSVSDHPQIATARIGAVQAIVVALIAAIPAVFTGYWAGRRSEPPVTGANVRCQSLSELASTGQLFQLRWRFTRTQQPRLIAEGLALGRNHRILGYDNPNEITWQIDNDQLVFYGADGVETSRFADTRCIGVLIGEPKPGVPFKHVLSPIVE